MRTPQWTKSRPAAQAAALAMGQRLCGGGRG
jgi:hypothetical protein